MTSTYHVEVEVETDGIVDYMDIVDKAIQIVEGNANMGATTNEWNNTILFDCDLPFEAGAGHVEITDDAFDDVYDQVDEQLSED